LQILFYLVLDYKSRTAQLFYFQERHELSYLGYSFAILLNQHILKMIEIKNFMLDYDGIYSISFTDADFKDAKFYTYFKLSTLLRMLEIEGLTIKDIDSKWDTFEPIEFKKVTLIADIDKEADTYTFGSAELMEWLELYYGFNKKSVNVWLKGEK